MAKYSGKIGYCITEETSPGVWVDKITERKYYGDVTINVRRTNEAEQVNNNVTINNRFSIIADPFASKNFHAIKYITYLGTKWEVTAVEVQYPRLIISAGGVFNAK